MRPEALALLVKTWADGSLCLEVTRIHESRYSWMDCAPVRIS